MAAKKSTKKRARKTAPRRTAKKVTDKDVENYFKSKFKCGPSKSKVSHACGGCTSAAYGLGFLGSAVYYISTATGFWVGVWGVIKALVWPAFLVYEVMKFIGM